ncbi:nitrite reductase small subunit NirD [Paenibacillus thailandensis]|jgi:nitrite reductase (NADH) small subunit|uniref:Nitrite reductase small subunit NirD n=1 Tax=Paenibacillus thailandensis TaxID=393250 RepID=A0ABW5R6P1_9BACL
MAKWLVGKLEEIDVKGSRTLKVDELEIAVFRLTNGEVLAVENRCPHKNGKLSEGMVCGTKVHCPLHDWKIDLRSGKVQEPDEGCITTFETEIDSESGLLYVTV